MPPPEAGRIPLPAARIHGLPGVRPAGSRKPRSFPPMPTYEYSCSECGGQFEFFQSMKDEALSVCPEEACPRTPWGKGPVRRRISSGAGLIFKGSGFYITDYRSEGYKKAARKEADAAKPPSKDKGGDAKAGRKEKKAAEASG